MNLDDLPPEATEKLISAFREHDTNTDGVIDQSELSNALKRAFPQLDKRTHERTVQMLMQMADQNGDGVLDFNEFHAAIAQRFKDRQSTVDNVLMHVLKKDHPLHHLPASHIEKLFKAFATADVDGDGFVVESEVSTVLRKSFPDADLDMIEDVANVIVETADRDGDGKIDLKEFINAFGDEAAKKGGSANPMQLLMNAISIQNALVHIPPAEAEELMRAFQLVDTDESGFLEVVEIQAYLSEAFPGVEGEILEDLANVLIDTADRDGDGKINISEFVSAMRNMKKIAEQDAKKNGGEAPATGYDGVLSHFLSHNENPLFHLTPSQVKMLLRHYRHKTGVPVDGFAGHADLSQFLQVGFPSADKRFLDEVAWVIVDTAPRTESGRIDVTRIMGAFSSQRFNRQADVSYVPDLHKRKAWVEVLNVEEIDILRDTFIRIDTDSDGCISRTDVLLTVEAVLGSRFAGFKPYLDSVFAATDKDADGMLSLSDFLDSYANGIGVVPQQAVVECVAKVSVRLSDERLRAIEESFVLMDKDRDTFLNRNELLKALEKVGAARYPGLSQDGYNELVSNILEAADRDNDGKLNLSEFIRSFQEDQGVLPVQLIEGRAQIIRERLSAEHLEVFTKVLTEVCATAPEFADYNDLYALLHEALEPEIDMQQGSIDSLIEAVLLSGDRDGTGRISIRAFVRSFSLHQHVHPNEQPLTLPRTASNRMSEEERRIVDSDQRNEHAMSDPVLHLTPRGQNGEPNGANPNNSSEVMLIGEDHRIFRKIFRYLDTRNAGYLVLQDVATEMHGLLRLKHPEWTDSSIAQVAESLFASADADNDGKLSQQEFIESFTIGYGIFPDDHVEKLRLRLISELPDEEMQKLLGVLRRIERTIRGRIALIDLQRVLTEGLYPAFDERTVAQLGDSIVLHVPVGPHGDVDFSEFLRSFERDQGILAQAPVADIPLETRGQPLLRSSQQQPKPQPTGPSSAVDSSDGYVTPYEIEQLQRAFKTIDESRDGVIHPQELRSLLHETLLPVLNSSDERVENVVASVMAIVDTDGDGKISFREFIESYEKHPEILQLPIMAVEERVQRTEETLEGILREDELHQIAKVFVHLDKDKNGVLDFSEVHDSIYSLLSQGHPEWDDPKIEEVVRKLYDTADVNKDGVLSLNEFIMSFATKHYVLPPDYVEGEAALLKRKLTKEEFNELAELFKQVDSNRDGTVTPKELDKLLREALTSTLAGDTATINAIVAAVLTVVDTNQDGVVSFSEFVEAYEKDTSVLDIPLMAASERYEAMQRQLQMILSERDLQRISKAFVTLDLDCDGQLSRPELREPMFGQLRASHGEWNESQVEAAIDDMIAVADINGDGMLSLDEFIGSFMDEATYVLPPSYVRDLCNITARELSEDEAVRIRIAFEEIDVQQNGFVTTSDIRTAVAPHIDNMATLDAICESVLISADEEDTGRIMLEDWVRCYRVDTALFKPVLEAIHDRVAAKIARDLLTPRFVEDITRIFNMLDSKGDGVLDMEELQEPLIAELGALNPHVQLRESLVLLAEQMFSRADLDKDNVLSLEEFIASFKQPGNQPSLLFSRETLEYVLATADDAGGSTPINAGLISQRPSSKQRQVAANLDGVVPPLTDATSVRQETDSALGTPHRTADQVATVSPSSISIRSKPGSATSPLRRRLPGDVSNVPLYNEELQAEFKKYDANRNGYLDKEEFKRAYLNFEWMGLQPSSAEVDRLFKNFGTENRLAFEDFCILMLRRSRM